jgi:membrane-bound lytic murein transglycosylase B
LKRAVALLVAALYLPAFAQGYTDRAEVQAFIAEMVARHGFLEEELKGVFSRVERAEPALELIQSAAQRPPWDEYRARFVNEKRIGAGLAFWSAHRKDLARAERQYGVPPEIIVGVIGVETYYGRHAGRHRVMDALTTLAFDYPARAGFFRGELEQYLLLARDTGTDVFSVRGSYAGAIGIPQFMPGSTRRYAVDFDGDGAIDLRASPADAIGSVANFLRQHGWQSGAAVQLRARAAGEAWRAYADGGLAPVHGIAELMKSGVEPDAPPEPSAQRAALIDLGSELRLGLQNFYVITRYNRSAYYAAAVADLAEALKARQSAGR